MRGAPGAAAELKVPICLMHMQGEPGTKKRSPTITMSSRRSSASSPTGCAAELAGVNQELILIDPGFGFGKTLAHNVTLLAELRQSQGSVPA